jgi:glyoxylase-like metal-dependent hydrolase (beta-lactamase superfamily II)
MHPISCWPQFILTTPLFLAGDIVAAGGAAVFHFSTGFLAALTFIPKILKEANMSDVKLTSMNRRAFVMSSAAGVLSSAPLLAFSASTADAKEAMFGNKAAAWYRFRLGDFEATVISDGALNLGPAAALYPKTPKETVEGVLASQFQSSAAVVVQENCLVLNTGDKLVLFDSGIGPYKVFGTTAGRLENTLTASGIKPDDIDAIILTHGHIDHLSGIMSDDGKRLFPNAQIIMSKVEHDFWTDEAKTSSTGVMKLLVDSARKNLLPNKDRMVFVEDGKEAIKGVSVVSSRGHTPGHASYLLSSAGQNFLFTGDAVTNTAISFSHPDWVFGFDADPGMASETRKRVLDMAVQDKLTLIGYHFAFPGIGNVAKEGDVYRFVPAAMDT